MKNDNTYTTANESNSPHSAVQNNYRLIQANTHRNTKKSVNDQIHHTLTDVPHRNERDI